jgi:hypothetical protein
VTAPVSAETANIDAARGFFTSLGDHLGGELCARTDTARATLAGRRMDATTLATLDRIRTHLTAMAALCATGVDHLDTYHGSLEQAVNAIPEAADTDFYRPAASTAAAGNAAGAPSSGRPPQQPDAAGVVWIDPHDGSEGLGRIVKRTKSSADIEWPNGRVEKGVKFTDSSRYGTMRWLTQQELDAEQAITWPVTVRGVDGLVGLNAYDGGVSITAGTAQQLAGIDPHAERDPTAKDRSAALDEQDLPAFKRSLGTACRPATQGRAYRKKVAGSDVGDIEVAVTPQLQGEPVVTLTVLPYVDAGDQEDLQAVRESDFGEVPDEIEDDGTGRRRALTAQERAEQEQLLRADYERYLREHPAPQPLTVTLTVPMVERLREQLAARRPDEQNSDAP